MLSWISRIRNIFPSREDDQDIKFSKIIIYVVTGLLLFMLLSGVLAFMLMVRSAEDVMIPNVTGMKLEDALIAVQDRGLNSRIQLRFSANPLDRGNIIEQSPAPGTIKKAGSHVVLRVSRGSIIDQMENYVGWQVRDLETHLKSLGATITINEPLIRIHSDMPEGTILEQKPLPGTDISSGGAELSLVVSLGPEGQTLSVPDLVDIDFTTAMRRAAANNIPFLFTQREPRRGEGRGVIVEQRPGRDENVPIGTTVQLTVTPPEPSGGRIFGILNRTLPEHPVAVDTAFYIISEDGVKDEVFRLRHRGGAMAIPFFEEEGTVLVISVMGRDLIHFIVRR
ncbi:MAG: PASTA domain-containing protein [Spirochaetaceae bacterium]|nr:PASTA domain-containing protein [Spirochaetaceae bacterium]